MIVVDTSIWIDAHRQPAGRTARGLAALIDADEVALALPVRIELTAGVARRDRSALVRALAALPVLRPSDETWNWIEWRVPLAADKGYRFGVSDWLVAALAHEIAAPVWSADKDFIALERLKFVTRHDPSSP